VLYYWFKLPIVLWVALKIPEPFLLRAYEVIE